jgi:hypothetical protein
LGVGSVSLSMSPYPKSSTRKITMLGGEDEVCTKEEKRRRERETEREREMATILLFRRLTKIQEKQNDNILDIIILSKLSPRQTSKRE